MVVQRLFYFRLPGRSAKLLATWLALIGACVGALVLAAVNYRQNPQDTPLNVPFDLASQPPRPSPGGGPAVGQLAPDFELINVRTGKPVRLSACRHRPVVLFFGSYS